MWRLKYFFKTTLSRRQQRDDAPARSYRTAPLGMVFYRLRSYEKALDHYQRAGYERMAKSLKRSRPAGDGYRAFALYPPGAPQRRAGRRRARQLAICDPSCTPPVRLRAAAYIRGTALLKHDTATARKYFAEALRLAGRPAMCARRPKPPSRWATWRSRKETSTRQSSCSQKPKPSPLPADKTFYSPKAYTGFIPLYRSQQNYERTTLPGEVCPVPRQRVRRAYSR